jgi:hypothetical protein
MSVTISRPNFDDVVAPSLARRIPNQRFGAGDTDLSCQDLNSTWWRFRRIVEECAEKADSAELHGEAEAHMIAAALADQITVGIIQVKVARELL